MYTYMYLIYMYESIYYLSILGNFIVIREKETETQFK